MRRQRLDGTWTYTSEAWDADWYWPVGTRVEVNLGRRGAVLWQPGEVTKQNTVSVRVVLDNGATVTVQLGERSTGVVLRREVGR